MYSFHYNLNTFHVYHFINHCKLHPLYCRELLLYIVRCTFHTLNSDFLKANFLAQSKCSDWKFCAETCIKNYINKLEARKTLLNCDKYIKLLPVFPVSRSLFQSLRRFSIILRNRVITWLQLSETLPEFTFVSIVKIEVFYAKYVKVPS